MLAWAHEDLLERVIAHLVQNGIRRVRVEHTEVGLVVERAGERSADRGHRPRQRHDAEFMRERLFKPFHTTKETGMGIGAFECQQYVQQVGGRIEVAECAGRGHEGACVPSAWRRAGVADELGAAA